jgi:NAD(P)H-hydrate epimerase
MCAEGALRGGAGLVALYVEPDFYDIAATRITPEVMVHAVDSPARVLEERADVIAIGPGLGLRHASSVLEVISHAPQPVVIDADGINALAADPHTLDRAVGPRLLTPHPGEMARLDPNADIHPRRFTAEVFTHRWPHALLFKGARSIVAQRGRSLSYNTTGHPGLATGGVGDVMTGLLAALAGQGQTLYDAARLGSWLIGRAAEAAIFSGAESPETLRPTALLGHLPAAFEGLRARCL